MTTEAPETQSPRGWERFLPWLVGVVGTAIFLRSLARDPSASVLERTFWYDAQYSIDAIAAIHRAIEERPNGRGFLDWLYSDLFFFPQPRPLVISELVPWVALVTYPLKGAPVLAYNVALAVACVLNVVAGTSFARSLGAKPVPSLLSGIALAFGAYANFQSGRLQLLMLFPVAWGLAAAVRFTRDLKRIDAILVGVNLFVAGGTCLYYAMFLALLAPPAVLLARLSERRPGVVRDLLPLALSLLGAALPLGLMLLPYRDLGAHLGLEHKIGDIRAQSGDALFLFWADHLTPVGQFLKDVYRWDTAYWPGLVPLLGAVGAVGAWAWSNRRLAARVLGPTLAGFALSPLLTINAFFVGCAIALFFLSRRDLDDRPNASPRVVFIAALLAVTWFVWSGPYPAVFGRGAGASPYVWLVEYAPFFSGLRMVRRAGIVFGLVASGFAAVWLSRLQGARGTLVTSVLLLLTFVESVPLDVRIRPILTTCDDAMFRKARDRGIAVVAEQPSRGLRDHEKTIARHRASTCGVATTLGPPGFQPFLAQAVDARLAALPDPWAHAALEALGIHDVGLRGMDQRAWTTRRMHALAPVTDTVDLLDDEALLHLRTTPLPVLGTKAEGKPFTPTKVTCVPAAECGRLVDGADDVRWTSGSPPDGTHEVVATFPKTRVSGLRWHHRGSPVDLPFGLIVEWRDPDGAWRSWTEGAIDVSPLGREAKRPVLTVALPPRDTDGLRLRTLGVGGTHWWSGTELQLLAIDGPGE